MSQSSTPVRDWILEAWAVFSKDWQTELRTRHSLHTIGLFAVTTLLMVSLALGPMGVSAEAPTVLPVVLWVILLFAAAAGLPRSFVHEEEVHTATALRLAATPSALFVGKCLYAVTLLWGIELVLVPLFLAMMQLPVDDLGPFVATLVAGSLGLAAASTLVAAMVSQAQGKGALFPILAFPVLIPLLLLVVELTRTAVGGGGESGVMTQLVLYDGALVVTGLMLFPVVWNP